MIELTEQQRLQLPVRGKSLFHRAGELGKWLPIPSAPTGRKSSQRKRSKEARVYRRTKCSR